MIDFPNSPTVGQVHVASNGAAYVWNGTLWTASSSETTPGGDFCAVGTPALPVTSYATIVLTSVYSGNSGGWYSTSTGRFTPPAGRYSIFATYSASCSGAASHFAINLRKNGVQVVQGIDTSGTAGNFGQPNVELIADSNGTDWFDVQGYASSGGQSIMGMTFQAFPISGVKGPPGDSTLQTVSYQTGAVATGTTLIPVDDTIPQITEGTEFMTLAITPKSATSKLVIDVLLNFANTTQNTNFSSALFQDSTANALAAVFTVTPPSANYNFQHKLTHTMVSGTTSATTFRVRAGPAAASTCTFNGVVGGRLMGGVFASSIVIREEAP